MEFIRNFFNKLADRCTRAFVLILVLSILMPVELLSTIDISEFGLGTTQSYATGGSGGPIGAGKYANAGIKSFYSGFKIGFHFDDSYYLDIDGGDTPQAWDLRNGEYYEQEKSLFLVPGWARLKDGSREEWDHTRAWSLACYQASSGGLFAYGATPTRITFTNGRSEVKSGYTNGIFYEDILNRLRTDYNEFVTKGYMEIWNSAPSKHQQALDNFEYITGWDSNGYMYLQERLNECFGWNELGIDNYDEWKDDEDKRLQNLAHNLDFLYQLYAVGYQANDSFNSDALTAITTMVKGEFKDKPFTVSFVPAVTCVGVGPGFDIVLMDILSFMGQYFGLSSSYYVKSNVFHGLLDGELSHVMKDGYRMWEAAINKDLAAFPLAGESRISSWGKVSGYNAFSWGNTGMYPGWFRTHTGVLTHHSAGPTDDMFQRIWTDYGVKGVDYKDRINYGVFYGTAYVHFLDTPILNATIGKIEALPDDAPVMPKQTNGNLGQDVQIKIHPQVKTDSNKQAWDNVLSNAETMRANGTFDGNFYLYIKVTRECDYAPWNGQPNFQDTTYQTGELNKVLSIEQLREFINGNIDISENVDLTNGYPVEMTGIGYHIIFTYHMELQLKATMNGTEYIFEPASEDDKVDTASFIIPAEQPDRLRYVSTQEAYAELKNYGDGSNQNGTLKETYEAMAGVPTTEQLYFAAGGSEFIVDVSLEYCKDDKAIRSYTSYFAGTTCEYHGVGKDGMTTKTTGVYSRSGTVSGDISGSWSVNTSNNNITCGCCVCGGGGDWTVTISAQYTNECFYHTCAGGENDQIITNGSGAYSEMCAAIAEIKSLMDADATAFTYTASSDGVTRTGRGFSWSANPGHNTPDGNDGVAGCGGEHNKCGSCCSGHSDGEGGSYTDGCGNACVGSPCSSGSQGSGGGTVTGTWIDHYICGPCCSHHLPDLYDTWSQSWTYDTIKIIDAHVWRIDQAAAKDLSDVIGPAVDNDVTYTAGAVPGTDGPYENPNGLDDGIVGASLKAGIPTVFYNIAMKNSNDLPGHDTNTTYLSQDGIGKATESSVVGRIRYNLNGNWTDASQNDMVFYNLGTRTNQCDGMAKTYDDNNSPAGGGGHAEDWADGFIYNSHKGKATHHGMATPSSVTASATQASASAGGKVDHSSTNYWHPTQWNQGGQTLYPLDDVYYLQEHCDGWDGSASNIDGNRASGTGNLDINTTEYAKFLEKRNQPMQATMISDYMVLQTTSGDQSIMYFDIESDTTGYYVYGSNTQNPQYDKDGNRIGVSGVAKQITAETMIPTIEIAQETMWENNPLSAAKWQPDEINVGGYNGKYNQPSRKFKGTGNNEKVETFFDNGDPAGIITRTPRPTRPLMLYSLPLNIITEIHNQSYLTSDLESEVFWTNNIHWSDLTSKAMNIYANPIGPDYSTTDKVGDTDNYDFSNFKDLVTVWGQDNYNVPHSYQGIIDDTKYSKNHDIELNGLIIQDQISTSEAATISLPDERDQRYANSIDASMGQDWLQEGMVCPQTAADCEFAVLNCKYGEDQNLAEYYFNDNTGVNSITNNSFGTPGAGWTISGGKLTADSPAVRISIPLSSELDTEYQAGTRLKVSADVTINDIPSYADPVTGAQNTRISQMLFGMGKYGLYVSTDGRVGFINDSGQYREATNITLVEGQTYHIEAIFSMTSLASCDVSVNGTSASFTSSTTDRQQFNSNDVGSYFNIGSMNTSTYGPRATYDNIVIARMGGTYEHTEDCYIIQMIHPSGMNAHQHTEDCILSGTETTTTPGSPTTYNYTGGIQQVTLQPGSYKLEVWGAQGGNDTWTGGSTYHSGGLGGYSYGNITLTKATTLYIVVGGKGANTQAHGVGYNGGGAASGHGSGGGGATHIATASGTLSNLSGNKNSILIVAGGGGGIDYGGSWSRAAGAGGGGNINPDPSYGNNLVATTSSGYAFGQGQACGSGGNNTGSGGGGYYGGYIGIDQDQGTGGGSSGGGGSAYLSPNLTNTGGSKGTRSGNGMAKITPLTTTTSVGYDKYKELYESGQLSIEDLKNIFGDAYDELFNVTESYAKLSNFTNINNFSDMVNCDLKVYSGDLVSSITGTSPSFVLNQSIHADEVLKVTLNITNNTSAKTAKIYWGNNGTFSEANSVSTSIEPNKANQTINFAVASKAGWRGTFNQIKFCIPADSDKNYGGSITISSIDFIYDNPDPQEFGYSTSAQTYRAKVSGYYLLEVWGAQGGGNGGEGGYTSAVAKINAGQNLYVYTGGQGTSASKLGSGGGYNGGGHASAGGYGGGGMTHISSSAGDRFSSTVTATQVDKGHWQLDPTASILGQDDDGGAGLSARLRLRLTAGQTYLFGVGRYSASRTGYYPYSVTDPSGRVILSGTCYCDEGTWSKKTYDPDCVWSFKATTTGTYTFTADENNGDPCVYVSEYSRTWIPNIVTEYKITDSISFSPTNAYVIAGGGGGNGNNQAGTSTVYSFSLSDFARSGSNATGSVSGGTLTYKITNRSDPQIQSSRTYSIAGQPGDMLKIDVVSSSGITQGQLYYTNSRGPMSETNVARFTVSGANDIYVPMGDGWGGATATRFRLDFDGSANSQIKIASIQIIRSGGSESAGTVRTFNYTGGNQTITLQPGTYKLEVWGAEGGSYDQGTTMGGYGGYAYGNITLSQATTLTIRVGGKGADTRVNNASYPGTGGWNGGGSSPSSSYNGTHGGGGGGKTDILSGSTYLIAAGGGGGGGHSSSRGNAGGNRLSNYGSGGTAGYCGHAGQGGTSYIGGVTSAGYNAGARSGNGMARITTIAVSASGEGGVGGGTSGGNGGGVANTAGTQSSGYKQGIGQSVTTATGAGGAGGGYWGGKVTNTNGAGGAGGSGYYNTSKVSTSYTSGTGKVYTATTTAGVNTGNGHAKITFLDSAPGPWPSISDILEVIDQIPQDSPIFDCNMELNTHVCDDLCRESLVLKCNEPHHSGNHYAGSDLCYDACMDDAKHKHTVDINVGDGSYTPGNFINLDWGFQLYFANNGDFYQSNTHGIGNLTNTRGIGYENDMDTSTWTRVKQVRLAVNAIYQGNLYRAGEWITLSDKGDYLGEDGSPYNERNWSHYGTQLYDDMYGNLLDGRRNYIYDFYCTLANHEAANAPMEFRAFAINNTSYDSDCGDTNNFPTYITNRLRQGKRFESKHSAYNQLVIDVVGRIGNLALIDTGDYRFSNLFKESVEREVTEIDDPTYYTAIDEEIEPNENAVFNGNTITSNVAGGGAVLNDTELTAGAYRIYVTGSGLTTSGLSIVAHTSWQTDATVTESDGLYTNTTQVVVENPDVESSEPETVNQTTVSGPGIDIKSGTCTITLYGEGLTLTDWRLSCAEFDLTPYITNVSKTHSMIVWSLELPNDISNFNVHAEFTGSDTLRADRLEVYRLNTDAMQELASSDRITNVTVSDNLRIYYVLISEDTTADISAISRSLPIEIESIGVQKLADDDAGWTVEGIIRDVDESKQRAYLTWKFDIRGLPISAETQWIDTYNTIGWAQTATCMTTIPLDASQNNISILQDEALLVGYDLYTSIGTIGDYYRDGGGFLQVVPEYYGVDIHTGEFFPVDVYIYYDNAYYPINIWGLMTDEDIHTWGPEGSGYDLSSIYNFATILRWNQEKIRRMVTPAEDYMTNQLREKYVSYVAENTWDYLDIPSGNSYVMGNAQFLQLNGNARTFVGGETTYSTLMNYSRGNALREHLFDDYNEASGKLWAIGSGKANSGVSVDDNGIYHNPGGLIDASQWWEAAQRWHLTLGLASSSVFVRSGLEPTTENIAELQTKDYVVLSTVDIRALGTVWNLIYTQENGSITVTDENGIKITIDIPEKIVINGHEHVIPPALVVYQTVKSSPYDIDVISNY